LAHDNDSERILAACGAVCRGCARSDAYLRESLEQTSAATRASGQTAAFRRVLQTA
jgi:hypothetical protein